MRLQRQLEGIYTALWGSMTTFTVITQLSLRAARNHEPEYQNCTLDYILGAI